MKKPTFFIIGAPKCGTTSWATWLAGHPQVFFSRVKEPHHFNTDHNYVLTPERDRYERLFRGATSQHRAIGEGSVLYLFSNDAVPNIEAYTNGTAKYIVCIRNPVEMAPSGHAEAYYLRQEHIEDFAQTWHLSDARLQGQSVTRRCPEPRLLAHKSICRLGEQLDRLYSRIPRERVHVILLDDAKRDPRAAYLSALEFLNLDDDGKLDFKPENPAKQARFKSLTLMPHKLQWIKDKLHIERDFGIGQRIFRANTKNVVWQPLNDEMRTMMEDYFREDIYLLQRLLGRDLSHWFA